MIQKWKITSYERNRQTKKKSNKELQLSNYLKDKKKVCTKLIQKTNLEKIRILLS